LSFVTVLSQENEQIGRISSLTFSPAEPILFEEVSINIGIENTGNSYNEYRLKVYVSKEGQIKYEEKFLFGLQPGRSLFISPLFVPDDIGEFEVVVKLYDKYEVELYDMSMIRFVVISRIGPFDISVDVLTRMVKPGEDLPAVLSITNMGERGTDVKVRVEILCFNQSSIFSEFYVFLESKSSLDRLVSLPVCQEVGMHMISSDVIFLNRSWVTAKTHFFINETFLKLVLRSPDIIEVEQGGSRVFDVFVENPSNSVVHGLKLAVERIPIEWVKLEPKTIVEVKPNETVLFIVNLTIPSDFQPKEYPISIIAGAAEVLAKEKSTLRVLEAIPPTVLPVQPSRAPLTFLDFLRMEKLWFVIIIVIVVAALIFISTVGRRVRPFVEPALILLDERRKEYEEELKSLRRSYLAKKIDEETYEAMRSRIEWEIEKVEERILKFGTSEQLNSFKNLREAYKEGRISKEEYDSGRRKIVDEIISER
jgi:hypothetical protein